MIVAFGYLVCLPDSQRDVGCKARFVGGSQKLLFDFSSIPINFVNFLQAAFGFMSKIPYSLL